MYNQVIILREFDSKVIETISNNSSTKVSIAESEQKWISIAGDFELGFLKDYEYYSFETDWQSKIGWRDSPL
jgi:hypothetical protein